MKAQNCERCKEYKLYIRRGFCKGCEYIMFPEKYKKHKLSVKDYAKTNNGKYLSCKSQAKERNIFFNITREQYFQLIKNPCDYCSGLLPSKGSGLDRMDSNIGYVVDNVVPCCTACNSIKGQYLTYTEMKIAMKAILEYRNNELL